MDEKLLAKIRRAVEVGLFKIKREFVPHALDLLDPLMYDDPLC